VTLSIGAVVVRYRGGDEVVRCLDSLQDHGGPALLETVVVDSGSGDGGAERLRATFPAVTVEVLEHNHSFAHAANHGAELISTDLLLLVNPDTEVLPGCLDRLADFLQRQPEAAGAVPLLEHDDGRSQHRWQLRRLPGPARLALGRTGAACFRQPPVQPQPVPQPAAAAWLLRRQVWTALGGFDTCFRPAWWEDVDFCARLDPAQRLWVVPGAHMRHLGGSSVVGLGDARFLAVYHRNLLRYAHRHHPRSAALIRVGVEASLRVRAILRRQRRAAYHEAVGGLDEP
jgi:GT2 family glycosyltransferase